MRTFWCVCVTVMLLVGSITQALSATPTIPSVDDLLSSLPSLKDYPRLSDRGFGDRLNAYAWAVAVFDDDLYVGTARHPGLSPVMDAVMTQIPVGGAGLQFPDLPTTPSVREWFDFQTGMVTNEQKFHIWNGGAASEIWRFDHETRRWSIVWKSPYVPSILTDPNDNQYVYYTPASVGIRKMEEYLDEDDNRSLFAFNGIGMPSTQGSSLPTGAQGNFSQPDYMPLAYYTQDGENWMPVETPDAMGSETRASTMFHGKLYVATLNNLTKKPGIWRLEKAIPNPDGSWPWVEITTSGPNGIPTFSLDPSDANNTNTGFICLKEFNDRLYVGTQNFTAGCEVWYGIPDATDDTEFAWTRVLENGSSFWAGTMETFRGALYVGTVGITMTSTMGFQGFSLYRVNANDSYEVIIGGNLSLRGAPSVSKLPYGCGNPFNFYCWSLREYKGKLYLGTFDMSVMLKQLQTAMGGHLPEAMQPLEILLKLNVTGADTWVSANGNTWTPVNFDGYGNKFNYGIRNLFIFENQLLCGTSNPFYGCEVLVIKKR